MYEVIHQKHLPGHFYTNPSTIHFFLVHFFKKYYEAHFCELMSNTLLQQECSIVDHDRSVGEISTLLFHDAPIVRLIKTQDDFEIHVLQNDVSYLEARKFFSPPESTLKSA